MDGVTFHQARSTTGCEEFDYTPRGSRISRLLFRIASRWSDYPDLAKSSSLEAALDSYDGFKFQGFNANPLRGRIVQALTQTFNCNMFIETGCFRAATTLAAHSFLKLPVRTCEKHLPSYLISRVLTFGLSDVEVQHADSVQFLRNSLATIVQDPTQLPFFFLDAHGGHDGTGRTGNSLPLKSELEVILTLPRLVVVIDDVELPGFLGGIYGDKKIDLAMVSPTLLNHGIDSCWVPAYQASQDLGWPSGYCIFCRGVDVDFANDFNTFPLRLLKEVKIQHRSC